MDWLRMIAEGNYQGELVLPPEVLDYWVETFEATDFTGGLNDYRANMADGGTENDTILRPSGAGGIQPGDARLEPPVAPRHLSGAEQPAPRRARGYC